MEQISQDNERISEKKNLFQEEVFKLEAQVQFNDGCNQILSQGNQASHPNAVPNVRHLEEEKEMGLIVQNVSHSNLEKLEQ